MFKRFLNDKANQKMFKKKIRDMEQEIAVLKAAKVNEHLIGEMMKLHSLFTESLKEKNVGDTNPPIIIEKLEIERVYVDKYETNNNIGAIGIKELGGRLNIGANYGQDPITQQVKQAIERHQEATERDRREINIKQRTSQEQPVQPKINIKKKL